MELELNQTAVWWHNRTVDGYGYSSFSSYSEIKCRWEDTNEIFRDIYGKEITSSAVVFVEDDVVLGDYLYLGDLDNLSTEEKTNPTLIPLAREVRQFVISPSIDGDEYVNKAIL